jgi:hypothetical protein
VAIQRAIALAAGRSALCAPRLAIAIAHSKEEWASMEYL